MYEAVLLAAVFWCAAFPFALIETRIATVHVRWVFQLYLLLIAGAYFVVQWVGGGQTLAMKTWRLRLIARSGGKVSTRYAVLRFTAALIGSLLFGVGFTWAFFDPDRQFLHDRIAGTRIVRAESPIGISETA